MTPKNVALVGAVCVVIGWILASTLSPPIARVQTRSDPQAPQMPVAVEEKFVEQLQMRLRQLPTTAPESRRNPFAFASSERATESPRTDEPARFEPHAVMASPIATPQFTLSGIGVSADVRTAVLTTGQDVHLVKLNDAVGSYIVVEITESSVTLARGEERLVLRFAQ